jgi:SET domain
MDDNRPRSGLEDLVFEYFDVKWITTRTGLISYFGCIASKDIPKHTLIHKERYTLQGQDIWTALEKYQNGEHSTKDDDDEYLKNGVGLSDEQREQLWSLHDQRHPRYSPRLMGIIYSNGFSNSDLGGEPCLFVGATSRFNHSCTPNVGMDFSGYEIRLFTTSSRGVRKGDELCLSYNEVIYYHSTTVRRAVLQHKYKFECYCPACCNVTSGDNNEHYDNNNSNSNSNNSSDERRQRLGFLARQLIKQTPRAHFLYDPIFEQSINDIQREQEDDRNTVRCVGEHREEEKSSATKEEMDEQRLLEQDGTIDRTVVGVVLEQLMEYMKLLEEEHIDHDLLQCSELAFDLSLTTSNKCHSPLQEDVISYDNFSPKHWAEKTLALYKLHKGEHHTSTKCFMQKLESYGFQYQTLEM